MKDMSVLVTGTAGDKIALSLTSLEKLKLNCPIFIASFGEVPPCYQNRYTLVCPHKKPSSCPNALLNACIDFNQTLVLRAEGLKAIKTRYVLVLEEGTLLKSLNFLNSLKEKSSRTYKLWLSEKVLIPAARYRLYPHSSYLVPFYFDYWIQAGQTSDLLKLWDLPLLDLRALGVYSKGETYPYALPAACAYLVQALKTTASLDQLHDYTHYSQTTNRLMRLSEQILVSCFSLLDAQDWQAQPPRTQTQPRGRPKAFNASGFYTQQDLRCLQDEAAL